ncbi:MAG: hypothetical protein PHV18_02165 [Lachnospiraceae bacterium]|nr:hypothetical protein [Lachnospiraceae bacterium]
MKKQKCIIVFLILSVLVLISGCIKTESKEHEVNVNPEPIDITESVPLDFEMETDYSNIMVKTELSVYPKGTEKIVYTITNNNAGKGFYYFSIPYIEYYDKDEWVRLAYYPPDYYQEIGRWDICGIEGNKEIPYSCNGVFYPQSILNGIEDGTCRLVIFAGNNEIYAEFKFEE